MQVDEPCKITVLTFKQVRARGSLLPHAIRTANDRPIPYGLVGEMRDFCTSTFGPGGNLTPGRRWVFDYATGYLAFKTATDMMAFVLRWSGPIEGYTP